MKQSFAAKVLWLNFGTISGSKMAIASHLSKEFLSTDHYSLNQWKFGTDTGNRSANQVLRKMTAPVVLPTEKDVIEYLCNYLETKAKETLATSSDFKVGLSGGSLINFLCKGLPEIKTEWPKWQFFFCDERVVPFDNSDSTFRAYKEGLSGKIPVQESQFVVINPALNVDEAADDYEKKLKSAFPDVELPSFDVLLLGVGPDGHTCSLFPGHSLLNETSRWIAPIADSPKPPPCRVTMTYPVLNHAKSCVFAMAGSGKAEIVNRLLKQNEDLPANRVKPTSGELIWILDQAAAASL